MEEGIRQGDATSTFLFCLAVDPCLAKIATKHKCWMYCDDLTVICKTSEVPEVLDLVECTFAEIHLKVNREKTRVLRPSEARKEPFIVLGADLACSGEFLEQQFVKQRTYFDNLESTPLHPQLKTSLLRLCGSPRIRYLAGVMPSEYLTSLTAEFDARIKGIMSSILCCEVTDIPDVSFYDMQGGAFPKYSDLAPTLFAAFRSMAIEGAFIPVELVPQTNEFPTAQHNVDAEWLWYTGDLSPAEFIVAYSIRLGFLPSHARVWPVRCECGRLVDCDEAQISHALKCDRFTKITHTSRHNAVRDDMARVARSYGITVVKEPTVYEYQVGKKRPDLIFMTANPITTDITVVWPEEKAGDAAASAATRKSADHSAAVNKLGHTFIPAPFEAFGLFGEHVFKLISAIAADLPTQSQYNFKQDMRTAISTSLAKSRAASILGLKWRKSYAI
jgi:hypothetical protein